MSNPSEVRVLRGELARVVAEARKRDAALERQSIQVERQRAQPGMGCGRIACCENPHSPPSADSTPGRRKKRAPGRDPADCKKPGRRPGHGGAPRGRRSQSTVHRVPGACGGCGGRLKVGRIADTGQATDVPPAPGAPAGGHGRDAPELAALHGSLAPPCHDAKLARRDPGGPAVDAGPMEAAAAAIARRFGLRAAGAVSATKLANAVPFLSTFVNLPGADPARYEFTPCLVFQAFYRRLGTKPP